VTDEIERRLERIREAVRAADLDAVLVCGSEYTGFEGAVFYLSGFRLLHRYAYVLLPADGEPTIVFPAEARWVGEHGESWIEDRVFAETPGAWLAGRFRELSYRRVGVYGQDYVMPVRDYQALDAGQAELTRFDEQFDLARAVKSPAELDSVRESMRINEAGFEAVLRAWEPGRSEVDLMAAAEQAFVARGTGRMTMDMILTGPNGAAIPEMRHPDPARLIAAGDLLIYGLEIAGRGGHWVEFSRPICRGEPSAVTREMMDAYREYHDIARAALRAGATAHDVHTAVSKPFVDRGYSLGHVTGHSIGMTMIEYPRIGHGIDVELMEDMVVSMHPHVIAKDERACLYFQDTWHVGARSSEPFSSVPVRFFDGSEQIALA
jgi:Xaa-Pro dipeptidase